MALLQGPGLQNILLPSSYAARHLLVLGVGQYLPRGYWGSEGAKSTHPLPLSHRPTKSFTSVSQATHPSKLDFTNTQTIHRHRSYKDLLRAYLVFKLCSFPALVKHADGLLHTSRKVFGSTLVNSVVGSTFFKHFCAGEDTETIRPTVQALQSRGVGAILDYAAEDDVNADEGPASRTTATASVICRTYDYKSEQKCDHHTQIFLRAIDTVAQMPGSNFAAIKVTALGNPQLLERMSTALISIRDLFKRFDLDGSGFIQEEEFRQVYAQLFRGAEEDEVAAAFQRLDTQHNGEVDYVSWTQRVRLKHTPYIAQRIQDTGAGEGLSSWQKQLSTECLTPEELDLVDAMMGRVKQLAEAAARQGVRLMIDAEHTYFQPAIDHVASELMRQYNKEAPLIYTTYQCYLRDSAARLQADIERSRRGGYRFGCKLVRGAYLVLERERAAEMGYPSPIWDSLQGTHANYNHCVEVVLDEVKEKGAEVMIATHNQESVEKALAHMQRLGWEGGPPGVYFGQLLGMADNLTFTLAQHGYRAFKYVPYGHVEEVMPYLIRRAQENADVMSGAAAELRMLRQEMGRRAMQQLGLQRQSMKGDGMEQHAAGVKHAASGTLHQH